MLLRCNATVIVPIRFPNYAIKKNIQMQKINFNTFQSRLIIYDLDLCSLSQNIQVINHISTKI